MSKEKTTLEKVTKTAADVAIGGTLLAADKAKEVVEDAVSRATERAEDGRDQLRDAADKAEARVRSATNSITESDGRAYEDRTRDELYGLAAEREIAGRSSMNKSELIEALRGAH